MGNRRAHFRNDIRVGWEATPPKSPPFNLLPNYSEEDTDIDDFFGGPSDSSFAFTIIQFPPCLQNPINLLATVLACPFQLLSHLPVSFPQMLVLLDVGTTVSGLSHALLDPGQIPKICEVTR